MVLSSEENNGHDNVGVVGYKLAIEVHKSQEGAYSFDRRRRAPFLDGREFHRVHANEALTNVHPKVFHGGGVKGAFRNLEGQAMFPKMRKDLVCALVV